MNRTLLKDCGKYFFKPAGKKKYSIVLLGFFSAILTVINYIFPGLIINSMYPDVILKQALILGCAYVCLTFIVSYLMFVLQKDIDYTNLVLCERIREQFQEIQASVDLYEKETTKFADRSKFAQMCLDRGFFSKISSLFIAFISSLILIISSFGVICIPLMVVVFLLIYACFVPLLYRCQKKVSEINFDETLVNSQLLREIETVQWNMLDLSNAKEVRSFNLSNFLTNKFNSLRKIAYKERHKKCDKSARYSFYCSIVYVIQVFVSYCFAVVCFNRQIIDVGSFLIYTGALISISTCINNFIECLVSFEAELKYFNALVDIFNEYDIGKENIGNMPVGKFESLEFKDVSFSYGNDDKYAVENISLKLHSGDKISIVGENGSGKSTFIKLLLGLYKPTKGKILINGRDVAQYDKDDVRALFAPVFQDYCLACYRISENVVLDEPYNEDKLNKALDLAGLGEKISGLEYGADTYLFYRLSESGTEMSGGEMQKLAMARAYYKNAPVLVLDEPTAALSPIAETELYEKVWNLSDTQTVLFISHRLSSCCNSDKILMFKDGRIAETGNHQKLMSDKGLYYELFSAQAANYQ